jgi:hypothetical protein
MPPEEKKQLDLLVQAWIAAKIASGSKQPTI